MDFWYVIKVAEGRAYTNFSPFLPISSKLFPALTGLKFLLPRLFRYAPNSCSCRFTGKDLRIHFTRSLFADSHLEYFQQKTLTVKLLNGAILPVIVNDPRLTLPLQKTSPSFKSTEGSELLVPSRVHVFDARMV